MKQKQFSLLTLNLLVAASFRIHQANTEKNVGHYSEIRTQSACEKGYSDYRLNGECYNLVDEDIVGCNCS